MSSSRKRGGQPHNTNAVKHGFYAQYFHPAEVKDLSALNLGDLVAEIEVMRIYIRRLIALGGEQTTLDGAIHILDSLANSTLAVSLLLTRNRLLMGSIETQIMDAFQEAISTLTGELDLH